MKSTWAVVPLKSIDSAKSRLAGVLSRAECGELVMHMAEDVIGALTGAGCFSGVGILTAEPTLGPLAERFDCHILHEETTRDWQQNLARVACDLRAAGVDTLVVVPGDLPTLTPPDVDVLMSHHAGGVTVAPAARDGGTNAIVMSPPDAMGFLFGNDSARRHLEAAGRQGLLATSVNLAVFAHDIDTPEDLREFCVMRDSSATRRYLERSGIANRLGAQLEAAG